MKATEIQIGDWIHHIVYLHGKDKPPYETNLQVKNIYGCEINCNVEEYEIISGTRLSECTPIPLTPEILEKNGWDGIDDYRQHGIAWGIFNDNYGCEISIDRDGRYFFTINAWEYSICEINGVHQLQHVLRLCGLNELTDNFKI